jgi:hypothetical protein
MSKGSTKKHADTAGLVVGDRVHVTSSALRVIRGAVWEFEADVVDLGSVGAEVQRDDGTRVIVSQSEVKVVERPDRYVALARALGLEGSVARMSTDEFARILEERGKSAAALFREAESLIASPEEHRREAKSRVSMRGALAWGDLAQDRRPFRVALSDDELDDRELVLTYIESTTELALEWYRHEKKEADKLWKKNRRLKKQLKAARATSRV